MLGLIAMALLATQPTLAAERTDDRAVDFVEGFFHAVDAFDFQALDRVFAPGARIVLPNGAELEGAEYVRAAERLRVRRRLSEPFPRPRPSSEVRS